MPQGTMSESVLDRLRVYKKVCHKIRVSLVAGREEVVSPRTVSRSFLDAYDTLAPASSTDSGIFPEDGSNASTMGDSPGGRRKCECPFVEAVDGWNIEYSERHCERCGGGVCTCHHPPPTLELRPMAEAAFRQHFYQTEHWNHFTEEPDIGPCLLSIKREGETDTYRILVRSSDHYLSGLLPASQLAVTNALDVNEVVAAIGREMNLLMPFKPALFPDIQKELLKIDETFVKSHHKVGVLKVKQGQTTEEEIFANGHEPGPFDEFLTVLGKRVKLQGFKGFLGGLDNDRDLTGQESVFTDFHHLEMMFHVAPLMPFTPNDPQQVNKKRHIGNDIVCLVFLENAHTMFNPLWVRSHFIHCYIIVQHFVGAHGQPLYKVAVATRSTVPQFPPELKHLGVFAHSRTLQQVLLTKLVNGERASYNAPKFLKLTNRSRAQLLHEFTACLEEHMMALRQGRTSRKVTKRSSWLPIGASRAPSPLMDSVREKYSNPDRLAEDFQLAFRGCELADVIFIVGEDRIPLYGVKAILACRSRVFRTMFKESSVKMASPMVRKRLGTGSSGQMMSPQGLRKSSSKSKLLLKQKKNSAPDQLLLRDSSPEPVPFAFQEDPRCMQIREQYVIEGFNEVVFSEVLNYLMTGSCNIKAVTIVGLVCAAEKYEIEELKQACFNCLPGCLRVVDICTILTQLEKYLAFGAAKTMVVQCLDFVDSNAVEILSSQGFLRLSENMVHLVLKRDASKNDVPEILKVKAAFAWGELNAKPDGPDFKTLVTPLVKHVRPHLIDPQEIMKTLVPSGIFDMDKLMTALAYQVDPQSVEVDNYTMFRPRKKSTVLSSR